MSRLVSATTPFPNVLLDEAMPCLKDTEWRVLCVIVRQTLGWQEKDSAQRKTRDWLTQVQLVKKTGRDRAALSRAIDVLVNTHFIEVRNEQGDLLSSPAERRHCKGRLFFALHPRFLVGSATKSHSVKIKSHSAKSECQMPVSNSLLDTKLAKSEYHRASKANTTKETLTKGSKENSMSVQTLEVFGEGPQSKGMSHIALPTENHKYSHAAQKFTALFQQYRVQQYRVQQYRVQQYRVQQYRTQMKKSEANICLTLDEVARLEKLLALHSSIDWKPILQAFFASEADYILRHNHSLRAFLDTCNIFLLRGSHAFGRAPDRPAHRKAITQS